MLETLTLDHFSPHVGTEFTAPFEDGSVLGFKLLEATQVGERRASSAAAPPSSNHREPFSLIFVVPIDFVLPQATYHLQHAEMGPLSLFLVPISKDADGVRYQAIFA